MRRIRLALVILAIVLVATSLSSQDAAEKATPFSGQILFLQFKDGQTQVIKNPTTRTLNGRQFVVGPVYSSATRPTPLAEVTLWIAGDDIARMAEYKDAAEYERIASELAKVKSPLPKTESTAVPPPIADLPVPIPGPAVGAIPAPPPFPAPDWAKISKTDEDLIRQKMEEARQFEQDAKKKQEETRNLIRDFKRVHHEVYTGHDPTREHFESLKLNGFKTIVCLRLAAPPRPPGLPEIAPKTPYSPWAHGFELEIDPNRLDDLTVNQFLSLQTNSENKIFVYDLDGSLTPAMWYLWFRLADGRSHAFARDRAAALDNLPNLPYAPDSPRAILEQTARRYADAKAK